ncbi:AAA family ATPase [Mycolicibacterium psychrotolerans]|uniref:AAA family ATPase n=1 Tax=Mycolicibacterium psychrotolerans TaxID=216929 RepID=UPI003D67A203
MVADPHDEASADDSDEEDFFDPWAEEERLHQGEYDPVADHAERAELLWQRQRSYSVEDEIRRKRLEQQWKPIDDQGTLAHQLQTIVTDPLFVIEDWFPDRTICQINAQFKIGKTTLVTNLVQALATGEPFLRTFRVHPKFKGHIGHWNMEVSQKTLLGWYRKQPMPPEALARCFPLSVRGNLSLDFKSEVVVEWTIKWLQNNNIKVWIIDPLSKLFRDDENNNYEFNQWWLKLEHIVSESGVRLVLLVHHTGHSTERARGASAMMGNPDVLLSYTHAGNLGETPPNNLRYLSAMGRDVNMPSTELDYEPDTNTLFATNSGTTRAQAKSDVKAQQAGVAVWEADDRIKTGDLYKRLNWRQDGATSKDNAAALKRAVQKGYIAQTKIGTTVWNSRGHVDPRSGQETPK